MFVLVASTAAAQTAYISPAVDPEFRVVLAIELTKAHIKVESSENADIVVRDGPIVLRSDKDYSLTEGKKTIWGCAYFLFGPKCSNFADWKIVGVFAHGETVIWFFHDQEASRRNVADSIIARWKSMEKRK
jgi:hypothetical protein